MTPAREWAGALSEVVVNSGPLIAGFDDTDVWHDECSRLLETLPGPLLVPATIVAEVCYIIGRYRFGAATKAAFLRSFASRALVVADFVEDDFERMAQLTDAQLDAIDLPPDELSSWAFVAPDELFVMVVPRLARRLAAAPDSRAAGVTRYLEHGVPG